MAGALSRVHHGGIGGGVHVRSGLALLTGHVRSGVDVLGRVEGG